ncbi:MULTISPECIES: hypothetical protein [unclassified Streptomyces]|uniref:hypothetical protein n=1 Tax=unclassified Streptomyces TaxID=2593676 RepID=UPI00115FBA83|nr:MULTISPECIES: hypothetical protein [unclassified Streptomyces]
MAGIYGLRLSQATELLDRTTELQRFTHVLQESNEQFIRFFSVPSDDARTLVITSDDLERPLAATTVKGTGADPATLSTGAVEFVKAGRMLELCETLIAADWRAASIAAETLASSPSQNIPVWLATPQTLARHYADRASRRDNSSQEGVDLERFSQAMANRAPGEFVRIFHVFDPYGWQSTLAVSGDLTEALGAVAVKR